MSCDWSRTRSRSSRCARPAPRPPRASPPWSPICRRRSAAAGASAGWRASSGCTPGTSATPSGYDTIAASGDHACTLHWIRNDGDLREGDLLLLDAGVELDTLYTADVTRTLPVNGRFSDDQRTVYEAVLEAQQAGIDAAKPGAKFSDVHAAAIAVLARKLEEWGLLPVTAEESLSADGGQHRRWMVHGTSHHLGIDVHDCAQARREKYREGTLAEGMIITVEPGLYFKSDDELVPENLRGIGVRIEDDIVITADGAENLSAGTPPVQRRRRGLDGYPAARWLIRDPRPAPRGLGHRGARRHPAVRHHPTEGEHRVRPTGTGSPSGRWHGSAPLDLDGLILYDIDDESDRVADDRPFPYLPTSDPAAFYAEHLGEWTKPVIVYRSIGKYAPDRAQRLARRGWTRSRELGVFVGASPAGKRVRTSSHARRIDSAARAAPGAGRGRGDDHRAARRSRRRAPADAGQAGGRVRLLRQPGDLRRRRHHERAVGLLLRLPSTAGSRRGR